MTGRFSARCIEVCFDALFREALRTTLRGGAPEPLYLPAGDGHPAQIRYRADFLASALHEVAHWCVAGTARRQLTDYGYWYAAEGRDLAAQRAFERVELRPQAIEGLFAEVLRVPFRVSLDNPGRSDCDPAAFTEAVAAEMGRLRQTGLPPRARRFRAALASLAATRAAPVSVPGRVAERGLVQADDATDSGVTQSCCASGC
mgnify:CR=1 FL=1